MIQVKNKDISIAPANKVIQPKIKPVSINTVVQNNMPINLNNGVAQTRVSASQTVETKTVNNVKPVSPQIQNTPVNSEIVRETVIKENTENKAKFKENEATLLEDKISVEDLSSWKQDQQKFIDRINKIKGNIVLCDYPSDELKGADILIEEGKLLGDRKMGAYVLSYDVLEDTINKIFVDDIINIDVNNYYDDVSSANPKYLGSYYNVYHKGRRVFDKISKKTYEFLKSKNLVPSESIITIDVKTRIRFFNMQLKDISIDKYKHELAVKLKTANRFEGFSLNSNLEDFEIKM